MTKMTIELHSYVGAFRPTDKLRPGFRTRDGTLIVLTHSTPKNKPFVLIAATNISSAHFTCKTACVYMCVADNQSAKRYNNVPGGKIYFSSHSNFTNTMKFLTSVPVEAINVDFQLTENTTITNGEVADALMTPEDQRNDAQKAIFAAMQRRDGDSMDQNFRKIQEAQITAKLAEMKITADPTFPENQDELDEIIDLFNQGGDEETSLAVMGLNLDLPVIQDVPVDPALVAETLQNLISEDAITATTEMPVDPITAEEATTDAVQELTEMPLPVNVAADSLQVSATAGPGELVISAGTLKRTLEQVSEIGRTAKTLAKQTDDLTNDLLKATVAALDQVAAQSTEQVDAEVIETTQL